MNDMMAFPTNQASGMLEPGLAFGSLIVSVHDIVAPLMLGFDVNPFIPADYQKYIPLVGVIIGPIVEWLRRLTTVPVEDKE